jgi:GABA(A) receptor-associated protein
MIYSHGQIFKSFFVHGRFRIKHPSIVGANISIGQMWKAWMRGQRPPSSAFDLSTQPTLESTQKLRMKYPDRVPVYVDSMEGGGANTRAIDKHRFLVPNRFTVGQFMHMIRKRIQLKPEEAIFMSVVSNASPAGILPPTHALMIDIHEQYKDKNDVLYIRYSNESVFG